MDYLANRKYILIFIFVFVGFVFSIKLFYIQLLDDDLRRKATDNILISKITHPYRGIIHDRNDKILVQNTPIFDLMITPKDVKHLDTLGLCRLLKISKHEFITTLKTVKTTQGYNWAKANIFIKQMSKEEVASIQDHLVSYNGFTVNARTQREYPHKVLSHVLGYIGEINDAQIKSRNKKGYKGKDKYRMGDYIGISGLEDSYEKQLKGKRGVSHIMVDVHNVEQGAFADGEFDTLSTAGFNLYSTIDIDIQEYGEFLMTGKRGSVVAIEPRTGEILTMVSAPNYDPNLLTGRNFGKNFTTLEQDTNKVLFNRPIMADQYPPGSIFKLLQSLVGLQEGVIKPHSRFKCKRSIINCHGPHSYEDLRGAIQNSCNPYFWNVFKKLMTKANTGSKYKNAEIGLTKWRNHVCSFGLGSPLDIDIANSEPGIIPSTKTYDRMYGKGRWKFSTIYSLAIGQGEIGISPIQMANFVSAIANKGYYIIPHFVKNIEGQKPNPKYLEKHYTTIDKKHFDVVIEGMERVINHGTGMRARLDSVQVCGKTGTSQNPHGEDHSVFIAFAPKENPKIAVAVYVENAGQGARSAAGIAGLIIEKYLFGEIAEKRQYMEDYILKNHFIY